MKNGFSSNQFRLISINPHIASNGNKKIELASIPHGAKTGDWISPLDPQSTKSESCSVSQFSKMEFPGNEWRRLQIPERKDVSFSRIQVLRFRSQLLREVRNFFFNNGFWEVETPIRVPSPGVETHLTAVESGDYFLSPSPEFQMKRLIAGGSGSIFQITKSFRAHEKGQKHNPEFTMLEWYSVDASSEDLMKEVEGLISHLIEKFGPPPVGTSLFNSLLKPPYKRITMAQAFSKFAKIENYRDSGAKLYEKVGFSDRIRENLSWEEAFFDIFDEIIVPALSSIGPCFLTQWPVEFASLSRPNPNDPSVADRFEFFAQDLELANGFYELIDYEVQKQRSLEESHWRQENNKPAYPMDEKFLDSIKEGLPVTSGIALGIDRLVMLFWGTKNISDVLTFPVDEL
jgi:elongation factor P--(R)-beta-lysine ligase